MVSGILAPKFVKHPFTIFRKARRDKQRASEFFQVIYQILYPERLPITPKISFAAPISGEELSKDGFSGGTMQSLVEKARQLFKDHVRTETSDL